MVVTKLFYETAPGQSRLGFLDANDQLLSIWFDALHQPNLIGMVQQVRITQVFQNQNRAMAKLANGETISVRLKKQDTKVAIAGAILPATIIAAPRHGKRWQAVLGARLVTKEMILLSGVAYNSRVIQLSGQIRGEKRKALLARLTAEAKPLLPKGFGLILRRGGVGLSDFSVPTKSLIEAWKANVFSLDTGRLGLLFDPGNLLDRARRLIGNVDVIDNTENLPELSMLLDDTISVALSEKKFLRCGGFLWCEQTQAVWSIDVDGSGVQDLVQLCDEAANEIARQIWLRGMSGPVLIDVPRLPRGYAKQFRAKLQMAIKCDLRQPEYLGVTRGGLIEIYVPHGDMALDKVMGDTLAQDALAALRLVSRQMGFGEVTLAVSPAIAEWLQGPGQKALDQIERSVKLSVCLNNDEGQQAHIINWN